MSTTAARLRGAELADLAGRRSRGRRAKRRVATRTPWRPGDQESPVSDVMPAVPPAAGRGTVEAGPGPVPVVRAHPARGARASDPLTGRLQVLSDALHRLSAQQLADDLSSAETANHLLTLTTATLHAGYANLTLLGADGELEASVLERVGGDHRRTASPRGRSVVRGARVATEAELTVALRVQEQHVGWLYVSDPDGGAFTADDRVLGAALARTAALQLATARTGDRMRKRLRWLQSSKDLSRALLSPVAGASALDGVARLLLDLGDADLAVVVTPAADGESLHVAAAAATAAVQGDAMRGSRYPLSSDGLVSTALRTGRAGKINSLLEAPLPVQTRMRALGDLGPMLAAPLSAEAPQGAVILARVAGRPVFDADDLEMAELFAHQAGVARQTLQARANQHRLNLLEDRDRLTREHNDDVLQRLFALGTSLQSVLTSPLERGAERTVERVLVDVGSVVRRVRRTVVSPPDDAVTFSALRAGVAESLRPLTASLSFQPTVGGFGPDDILVAGPLAAAVGAVAYELVRRAATSAEVSALTLELVADEGSVSVIAVEHGRSGGAPRPCPGDDDLAARAEELDGAFAVTSAGPGTRSVTWTVPLD